ncbi:MAG: hypothetical protein WCO03_02700, partial [bacterium]
GTTSYWFEYSINDNLSSPTTSIHQQLNSSGSTGIAVSLPITGLQNNTKYFYRLAVSNSSGIVLGNTTSFKTKH